MKTVKEVLPLVVYVGKLYLEKLGRRGFRVNVGVVFDEGRWKGHLHHSDYKSPCKCMKCYA